MSSYAEPLFIWTYVILQVVVHYLMIDKKTKAYEVDQLTAYVRLKTSIHWNRATLNSRYDHSKVIKHQASFPYDILNLSPPLCFLRQFLLRSSSPLFRLFLISYIQENLRRDSSGRVHFVELAESDRIIPVDTR